MKRREPTADHLDRLQATLGIKLRRTDAFDFCYYHFYELMDFTTLLSRRDPLTTEPAPVTFYEKRRLVKLCRAYDDATETEGRQGSKPYYKPRVRISHCFKSLNRVFDKHFDDLLFVTHEESKLNSKK